MTVRMATCKELSDNAQVVSQLAKNYWDVEKSATPVAILLPWFPSSARKIKIQATRALYNTIFSYVSLRRKSTTPSVDAIDFFISQGVSDSRIVEVSPVYDSPRYVFHVVTEHHWYHWCRSG